MARVVPCALAPCRPVLRPTVATAPLVHVIVTVPVPSSGVAAWVTTGSYAPKLIAVARIVQLADTDAVTLKLVDADAAQAGPAARRPASPSATPAAILLPLIVRMSRLPVCHCLA